MKYIFSIVTFLLFAFSLSAQTPSYGRGDLYFQNRSEMDLFSPVSSKGSQSAILLSDDSRWTWDSQNLIWVEVVDEDTQLTADEVNAIVDLNGYITEDTNTQLTADEVNAIVDLNGYITEDTNTQLTADEVNAIVNLNGYLTEEVDGSTTNEIQDLFSILEADNGSSIIAENENTTIKFSGGLGMETSTLNDEIVFSNTAPDQVIEIIGATGTYPNFTIPTSISISRASATVDVQNINDVGILEITSTFLDPAFTLSSNEFTLINPSSFVDISCIVYGEYSGDPQRTAPTIQVERNTGAGWLPVGTISSSSYVEGINHVRSSNTLIYRDNAPVANAQYRIVTGVNGQEMPVNSISGEVNFTAYN